MSRTSGTELGRALGGVLMLDDLHWADQPSLMLLQFVARELGGARLLLVGTYRDVELSRQHPLAETLGELTRERLLQRVLLRGLSREDTGRFIHGSAGETPPQDLVETIHARTQGNPFFVIEVVRFSPIRFHNHLSESRRSEAGFTVGSG